MESPITTLLLVGIIGASLYAWNNHDFMNKMIFHPASVKHDKGQLYRFLSSGFVHLDYMHLALNALGLWVFGKDVERYYTLLFGPQIGMLLFFTAFIIGVIISSIPAYLKNRDNDYYRSLGASGGISTIIFMFIILFPTRNLNFMFIPIPINAVIMGIAYVAYSQYMSKKGVDNVGHDAHLWGSFFGIIFIGITLPQAFPSMYYQIIDLLSS